MATFYGGASTIGGHQEGDGSGSGQQTRAAPTQPSGGSLLNMFPWGGIFNQFQNIGAANARTDLWGAKQRYGVGMQGVGIDRNALNRQIPLINQRWSLQKGRFGLDKQGLKDQFGRIGGRMEQARYMAGREHQELEGESAARGAATSLGRRRRDDDIESQLAEQLEDFRLQRRDIGRGVKRIGLDKKEGRMLMREEKRKVRDGLKHLDLEAKRLGISLGEAKRRLNNALQSSGLSAFLSVSEMLQGLADADSDVQRRILGILQNRV